MPVHNATLAKPYAEALFRHGQEQGGDTLVVWLAQLAQLAAVVGTEQVAALLASPSLSQAQKAACLAAVMADDLSPQAEKLLVLLAENKRLALLPDIYLAFAALKAEAERRLEVQITTAFPLDEAETSALTAACAKHFGRDVTLTTEDDPDLVAGAVIRAGDAMIDASYRGRLSQLRKQLQIAT